MENPKEIYLLKPIPEEERETLSHENDDAFWYEDLYDKSQGDKYIRADVIEEWLAEIYRRQFRSSIGSVGEVCDEIIDKSGALLGRVRQIAWKKGSIK